MVLLDCHWLLSPRRGIWQLKCPHTIMLYLWLLDVVSGVYLITSSDVTVRVGEQLQLNCTVMGSDNSSKYQLSWYHGKQKLGENVIAKLRNNTVQVNIDPVDWKDNGSYVCKETANSGLQPRSVVVRVGGRSSSYWALTYFLFIWRCVFWGGSRIWRGGFDFQRFQGQFEVAWLL